MANMGWFYEKKPLPNIRYDKGSKLIKRLSFISLHASSLIMV